MGRGISSHADIRYVRPTRGKACLLLALWAEWLPEAVQAAIAGLSNAPLTRSRFANILSYGDLRRFVDRETPAADFGRLGCISFLFLLRFQS